MLALQEFDVDIGKIFYLIWSRGGDITQLSSGESALTAIYQHDNYGLMNILLKHDEGENVLLGLSLSEVINDLQKLGKVGILKAFKENDLILPAEESIDSALDVSKSEARIADVELEVEAIGLNAI